MNGLHIARTNRNEWMPFDLLDVRFILLIGPIRYVKISSDSWLQQATCLSEKNSDIDHTTLALEQ